MLDFAFGPNGYGLTEGMRKEQDRITQNRSQFANNMATFLANNPYISPEAAQAFINSAAGTDNTLRGSVPNQLIGELNKENTRKRRIDTFQAFNEFTRLNPGASAAEFQSAMSALGAQGIYGADALKAIQGRADQYRKDQDTKRLYTEAQNIGQLRTQLMADAKSIFIQNGYDVEKTKKQLESIYGKNMPVPIDSIVNPGMATTLQGDLVREYLPKAVDIIGKNPNMTPEMMYGIFPELQGSPVVKSIYEAAQTERKKGIQDKFYGNKKQVVDSVASSILLGSDPQTALSETIRGLGISPEDMANLDTSTILSEAKSLADKTKADKDTALKQKHYQAAATVSTSIQAKIGNEVDASRFASMSNAQLEQELRKVVEFDSGLTPEEIAQLSPDWYARLTTKIRQDLETKALAAQQQRYDASRGIESTAADALRKDSEKSAELATSEEALTFLGLKDAASGGGIQAAVRDLATRYDMSGGRASTAIQLAIDIMAQDPNAGAGLAAALEKDVRFQQMFRPISQEASEQATIARIKDGSDQPRPVGFTPWVQQEAATIRQESDGYLADIQGIMSANQPVEKKIQALEAFNARFSNDITSATNAYQMRRESQHRWTSANDRWNDDTFSTLRVELQSLQTRVQVELNKARYRLDAEVQKQKQANMAPGKSMERPDDPNRSGFVNDLANTFMWTPERVQNNQIQQQIYAVSPGESGLAGYFFSGQQDREIAKRMVDVANNMKVLNSIREHPEVYALISPDNPNPDVLKFLEIAESYK
jgi:hypothetical protein